MKKSVFIKNKKRLILIYMLVYLVLLTACDKKEDKDDMNNLSSDKEEFITNVESIIKAVDNNTNFDDLEIEYYSYSVNQNYISDMVGFEYDISKYNINNGAVVENLAGKVYISLENDDYCAIKDFNEEKPRIYDIAEKEKCHHFSLTSEKLYLNIIAYNIENNKRYEFGEISDSYIDLLLKSNLIDSRAVKYKWYRNGVEIPDSNVQTYTITSEIEDANYYVEIITPNGEVYKSDSINVKIDRR